MAGATKRKMEIGPYTAVATYWKETESEPWQYIFAVKKGPNVHWSIVGKQVEAKKVELGILERGKQDPKTPFRTTVELDLMAYFIENFFNKRHIREVSATTGEKMVKVLGRRGWEPTVEGERRIVTKTLSPKSIVNPLLLERTESARALRRRKRKQKALTKRPGPRRM